MTDPVDDADQARLDRIARLTARRSAPGPSPETRGASARQRRRHPAQRARIVAASLGATTMFGIVTMLGVANASSTQSVAAVTPTAVAPKASTTVPIASTTPPTRAIDAPSGPAVIVLTARPVVQVVAPAPTQRASTNPASPPAPVATTRGSS